ncbi:hypothetical protein [Candidatus Pelagibacter sp. HIMB1748]|uniref:hypothetical protein n=1 Tax=unclassified Candidatus Pelagibacter TaxID=2647897 RepID=UPI003F837A4C
MGNFYNYFNSIKDRLGIRKKSFSMIFEYLDKQEGPINIVETGCLRIENNFEGDGQSTLQFDKYTLSRENGSKVYTVDINPNATKVCKSVVSKNVEVNTGDSVTYLVELMERFNKENKKVTLFYLDSFDVDWQSSDRSAAHHLKELTAIINHISEKALVVVDDAPILMPMKIENNRYIPISNKPAPGPFIGGKGYLVNEFANAYGAKIYFSDYQTAWLGFKK